MDQEAVNMAASISRGLIVKPVTGANRGAQHAADRQIGIRLDAGEVPDFV